MPRLGAPELIDDARFADAAARAEHRQQLESLLTPLFMKQTAIVWSRVLDDHGVPNEVPFDTKAGEHVFFDADNERLGIVAEYEHPIVGRMRQFGKLIDFSETPSRAAGAAAARRPAHARHPRRGSATTTRRCRS